MKRISAREFQNRAGEWQDVAKREPITITKHGRDSLVLMAVEEYERLSSRRREVYACEQVPDDVLDMIVSAQPSAEAADHDREVEDALDAGDNG